MTSNTPADQSTAPVRASKVVIPGIGDYAAIAAEGKEGRPTRFLIRNLAELDSQADPRAVAEMAKGLRDMMAKHREFFLRVLDAKKAVAIERDCFVEQVELDEVSGLSKEDRDRLSTAAVARLYRFQAVEVHLRNLGKKPAPVIALYGRATLREVERDEDGIPVFRAPEETIIDGLQAFIDEMLDLERYCRFCVEVSLVKQRGGDGFDRLKPVPSFIGRRLFGDLYIKLHRTMADSVRQIDHDPSVRALFERIGEVASQPVVAAPEPATALETDAQPAAPEAVTPPAAPAAE